MGCHKSLDKISQMEQHVREQPTQNPNLIHFHLYYRTVINLSQVIHQLKLHDKLSKSTLVAFKKTILAYNAPYDITKIKLAQTHDEVLLKQQLKTRLNTYYQLPGIAGSSIRCDYVYCYFKFPPMYNFIKLLDISSINFLIRNCSFFELVDDSFYLQKAGQYFCDFVWNKVTPIVELSGLTNDDGKTKVKRTWEGDCNVYKKLGSNCDRWCSTNANRNDVPINRKKILYGKQSSQQFNSYLDTSPRHLISKLFSSLDKELRESINSDLLINSLEKTIIRNKSTKFQLLAAKLCPASKKFSLETSANIKSALESSSNHKQVTSFMYKVYHHLFSIEIFGSRSNYQAIFNRLKLLVTSGVKVRLRVDNFRPKSFNVDCIPWLKQLNCIHKKLAAFDILLSWLIDYFINLLRSQFYITESKSCQLHFYNYSVWNSIRDKFINKLIKQGQLKAISNQEIKEEAKLDKLFLRISNLRFIPRPHKLRMINRLRIESQKSETRSCLNILSYFLGRMVQTTASQRHRHNIFQLQEMMKLAHLKKLYFVRVDVVNCYPSIDQGKLYDLICDKLNAFSFSSKDVIKIKEFDLIKPGVTKLNVKKHHFSNESRSQFTELINRLSFNRTNCVIVPKRTLTNYFLQDIRALFRSYILSPYLRLGPNRYYQLLRGIRQGGTLSSDLCSLYISHVLDQVVGDFGLQNEESRLILEDDLVFITSSVERAHHYLRILINNFPKHGLEINLKKLQFNFDYSLDKLAPSEFFTFLGRDVYLNSKKVYSNYEKYQGESSQYFFTCNPFAPKDEVRKNLINHLNLSMLPWDLDCNINDEASVALSIYQRALLQATRLSCYLISSPKYQSQELPKYWVKFSISFAKRLFHIKERWLQKGLINCSFSQMTIQWITNEAILRQLSTLKMRHRKTERREILSLRSKLGRSINPSLRTEWIKYFTKSNSFNPNAINLA